MKRIKDFFVGIYYFLSSRYFLKHFGLMAGSFLLLLLLLFWYIKWYTLHGESIEVPDLVYQRVNQIEDYLKVRKLRYEIADSVYYSDKEPGIILEQYPKANSRVKESRKIYLVVNRWSPPSVNLYYKDLVGRPLNHVQRKFKNLDLRLGKLTYISGPAENTVAKVMVNNRMVFKEADPSRGEKIPTDPYPVPKGTVVDLVLFEGIDAAPRTVPMVQCLQYGDAEFAIKTSQFNVGDIHINGVIPDTIKGWVWKQSPAPGTVASAGTGISVWLIPDAPSETDCNPPARSTNEQGGGDDGGWGHQ